MNGIFSDPMTLGAVVGLVVVVGYLVYAYMKKKWPFS